MQTLELVENDNAYAQMVHDALSPAFLVDPIGPDPEGHYSKKECAMPGCKRISKRLDVDLCRPHGYTFMQTGMAPERVEEWVQGQPRAEPVRDTKGLFDVALSGSELLRDELAFGLMKRGERDQRTSTYPVTSLARVLRDRGISSILKLRHDEKEIDLISAASAGNRDTSRAFLLDTLDELCLMVGVEPTRRSLGIASAGRGAFTNLNQILNPEFRESIRRWTIWRRDGEIGTPQRIQAVNSHLSVFCDWLDAAGVVTWPDLTRSHLVEFQSYLNRLKKPDGDVYSAKYRNTIIGSIAMFIDEVSINGWAAIPASARWLRNERPKIPRSEPNLIGKSATARLRTPGNLQLIEDLDCRLIIRIMSQTGLRRKDVSAGMTMNSLVEAPEGKWAIRYKNSKNPDWSWAPVELPLVKAIHDHMKWKRTKFPNAHKLFAVDVHDRVITLTKVNAALTLYALALDLRDSSGNPLRVTPHMFRHQNATDWLDQGLPIQTIQKLLGQRSLQATEIYARMSESKAREEWEKTVAIDRDGQIVQSQSGDIADAAWAHAFLGGASQALPNGRCGMPCSETCEHANACLYCPLFLTTPEYLPVLREQRDEHAVMIEMAEREGHQRIVEKNQKPFFALTKLITRLEKLENQDLVQRAAV